MSIKLVAVDIDGTLITSDRKITPEVYQAIQDAKAQESRSSLLPVVPLLGYKIYLMNLISKIRVTM